MGSRNAAHSPPFQGGFGGIGIFAPNPVSSNIPIHLIPFGKPGYTVDVALDVA